MSSALKKPRGLGKGLEVLLGPDLQQQAGAEAGNPEGRPSTLPLSQLQAGKYQPRTHMDEGSLYQLAESIRSQGIMQPILVRPLVAEAEVTPSKGSATVTEILRTPQRYEIIAGERRFRAAQIAGLTEVPVLIRAVADENAAVMALIENIQREDLNPIEEAQGLQRLVQDFGLTHEAAAQAVGRSRSAATNLLRLLQLAEPVQKMLLAGDIDMGHARSLLSLSKTDQMTLAQQIASNQMSVREAEALVKRVSAPKNQDAAHGAGKASRGAATSATHSQDRDWKRVEEELSDCLTTVVQIELKKGASNTEAVRGAVTLPFANLDELQAIIATLKRVNKEMHYG